MDNLSATSSLTTVLWEGSQAAVALGGNAASANAMLSTCNVNEAMGISSKQQQQQRQQQYNNVISISSSGLKRKADYRSSSFQLPEAHQKMMKRMNTNGLLRQMMPQSTASSSHQQTHSNSSSPVPTLPPLNDVAPQLDQGFSNSNNNGHVLLNEAQKQQLPIQQPQQQQFGDMSWSNPFPIYDATNNGTNNCNNIILQQATNNQVDAQMTMMMPVDHSNNTNGQSLMTFLQNPNLPSPISSGSSTSATTTATTAEPSCVHRSCQLFPNNEAIIKGAVELDPGALRRKASVNGTSIHPVREQYGYPLNIALRQDASLDVLKVLVKGAPDVITCPDGRDRSGSLNIALRRKPNDLHILHLLVIANPDSLRMKDRRLNTPLHIAVARGASVDVIKPLYLLYPDAILERNINGETPFEVSSRTAAICSDAVVNFLQTAYNDELRKRRRRG